MTTTLQTSGIQTRAETIPSRPEANRLLSALDQLAECSDHLLSKPLARIENGGQSHQLQRYVYLGPQGGGDPIRIGIFAGIHGDEPEGAFAVYRFISALERNPDIAKGYILFIYPICNPTGFADRTRHSRSGKDLNREFWKQSTETEVRQLESEICLHAFHGIITLHSDDTSDGLYGFVNRDLLSEFLLEPALRAAEEFLPRNRGAVIDGFPASNGIINRGYNGMLQGLPGLRQAPFEITLETPQKTPVCRQVDAFSAALISILDEYRQFMAIAQGI